MSAGREPWEACRKVLRSPDGWSQQRQHAPHSLPRGHHRRLCRSVMGLVLEEYSQGGAPEWEVAEARGGGHQRT